MPAIHRRNVRNTFPTLPSAASTAARFPTFLMFLTLPPATSPAARFPLPRIRCLHKRRFLGRRWFPASEDQRPFAGRGEHHQDCHHHEGDRYYRIQPIVEDEASASRSRHG